MGPFPPEVKEWCESRGFRSVYSAKTAWLQEDANKGKCFFHNSDLGVVMGGCFKADKCYFASSHG